jgi:undecaprenyl diphosphate synthase
MNNLRHIAIIMDGNGRWAKQRHKPRIFGHIKGARVAKKIITHCVSKNIQALTLYAFSSENWLRPPQEVQFLMFLLQRYLKREVKTLIKQNVRFQVIGDRSKLTRQVLEIIEFTEGQTAHCTGMVLTFAISYGSRSEITTAARIIAEKVLQNQISIDDIDEALVNENLFTNRMPDPDIIIRTSGEERLSNFLLWQAAYSEFFFVKTLWPDFTSLDLDLVLLEYAKRSRRFGKVENAISHH